MIPMRSWIGSGLTIIGALLLGNAIHLSFIQATHEITSFVVISQSVFGVLIIVIGYRWEDNPLKYLDSPNSDEEPDDVDETIHTESGDHIVSPDHEDEHRNE